jgi:hypothetical protein
MAGERHGRGMLCVNPPLRSADPTALCSGFQNRFILDRICSNTLIISVLFFQIVWIVEFKRPNSRRTSDLYFPFSICCSPSTLRTFLFVTVAMLSLFQSPVNCRIGNAEGNVTHKVKYRYYCHFPGLKFMKLPESVEGLPSQGQGDCRIRRINYFSEYYIGTDDW